MVTLFNRDKYPMVDDVILGWIQDRTIAGAAKRAEAGGATQLATWLRANGHKAWAGRPLPFGVSGVVADGRDWTIINTDRRRRA
jgi:hypothetical protein